MKEMAAPGHNRNRQCLWARPVQDGRQQHGVVLFAMHDQCFEMGGLVNGRSRRPAHARADQYQLLDGPAGIQAPESVRGDKGPEGKARKRQRQCGAGWCRMALIGSTNPNFEPNAF